MTALSTPDLVNRGRELLAKNDADVLIKSRDRVRAYGEVFTPHHMVNTMLDLVRPELETGPGFVDKTFFEPAAGDGKFLVAILHRKLVSVGKRYSSHAWPSEALFALASIYGIELLEDNHALAQSLMLTEFINFHDKRGIRCTPDTDLYRAARHIISANVIHGNTLTGLDNDSQPITFSWWQRVLNEPLTVQREVFTLSSLRDDSIGMFNFDVHPAYAPICINHVFKETLGS